MNVNNFNPNQFPIMLNMMNNIYPNMGFNMNNFNNLNNQSLMNTMANWMNMNPFLIQAYNNMIQMNMNQMNMNQMNMNQMNMNQMNMNQSNNKMNFVKVSNSEAKSKTSIFKNLPNMNFDASSPFDNSPKANIVFNTQKGHTTNLIASYNMKVKDLLLKYVEKLGLGPGVIGDSIFFLFNGKKLKLNEEKTVCECGLHNGGHIVVLDIKEVIGAKNFIKPFTILEK